MPLIRKKCFPSGQCWCRRKRPHILFSLPSLYPSCRVYCAPWSLPRSQQDQTPIVHRSNLKIFWPHETWTVSHPVRRGQRCVFSFVECLDWTNPASLKQYLNDILHLISQIIVTKMAQPLLCSPADALLMCLPWRPLWRWCLPPVRILFFWEHNLILTSSVTILAVLL